MKILYTQGYKYQLKKNFLFSTGFVLPSLVKTDYIEMTVFGVMTIKKGYAWDGATWCVDTKNTRKAALVHDALYAMIRMGCLPPSARRKADLLFKSTCLDEGMNRFRAAWLYRGVREFGDEFVKSSSKKKVLSA